MIFQTCCTYNRFFPLNCVYYKTYRGVPAQPITHTFWLTNRNYGFAQHKPQLWIYTTQTIE